MDSGQNSAEPEHTAVRVALWRALHAQIDANPLVFNDEIGLKLVDDPDWRSRPDMNPDFSKSMRASIVARARFIDDLIEKQVHQNITQYVILGAGLDTFAQRHPEFGPSLQIYEVDKPEPQAWKKQRLTEIGLHTPDWLHFVPVNFEAGQSWWENLLLAGFDSRKPALVVSTGVSMYLTKEANLSLLQQMAQLAPGSIYAMTFLLALELLESKERAVMEFVMKKAHESGTPFYSLFQPSEILALAKEAGFKSAEHVSAHDLYQLYLANRPDGLNAGTAEGFLLGAT